MGRLLEDMTRLVGEIQTLHGRRRAFREKLADGERDRQMVAKGAKGERLAGERDRQTVAKGAQAERLAFVENLKQTVGEQRRKNSDENAARHRAWAEEQAGVRRVWAGHGQQPEMSPEFAAPRRARRAGGGA